MQRDCAPVRGAADLTAAEEHLAGRGRILVRPSGTEPLVRIMVDADTEALKHEGRNWIDQPRLPEWPVFGQGA